MKIIQLTQGFSTIVDDEDFDRLSQFRWHAHRGGNGGIYAERSGPRGALSRSIRMHREIAITPSGLETDHKNGNTLDNRRENLRLATGIQNQRNSKKHSGGRSQFKGVSAERKRWRARLTLEGGTVNLGIFTVEREAALAYDAAARKYFGDFARTNYGPGSE